ncbi:hypothetical protein U8V72_17675 [Priestia filamentosa]|uniref:hypothetical protein n=1 Tax=Priestia filamentosa TaxID=1402861 RepID=UPI0039790B3B
MSDEKDKKTNELKPEENKADTMKEQDELVDIKDSHTDSPSETQKEAESAVTLVKDESIEQSENESEENNHKEKTPPTNEDTIEEDFLNKEKVEESQKEEPTYQEVNGKADKTLSKKESFFSTVSLIGVIIISLLALAFIYTSTLTNKLVSQNTLIVQEELADTSHLLEMYMNTDNEKYITLAYGNLKETQEVLRQTLLQQSTIDFFIHPRANYELLHYLEAKTSYFENVLYGNKNLRNSEITELYLALSAVKEHVLPTTDINKFVRQTDFILNGICNR